MRRVFVALAVFGLAAAAPLSGRGDDAAIKRQIINRLSQEKAAGNLQGFDLDLKVEAGVVWLQGRVASPQQEELVLKAASQTPGVAKVMKNLQVAGAASAASPMTKPMQAAKISQPASVLAQSSRRGETTGVLTAAPQAPQATATAKAAEAPPAYPVTNAAQMIINPHATGQTAAAASTMQATVSPAAEDAVRQTSGAQTASPAGLQKAEPSQPQLMPVNPYYNHPYAGYYPMPQTPVAFAPAQQASAEVADAAAAGAAGAAPGMAPYCPPTHPVGYGAMGGGVRYDHPHLPAYSWPTYAAYPNYAAVTYPKQYSPTVWPYIGPFYPYPQVPLGWRKVQLEWDDGWWHIDFIDQNRPWKR